VRGVAQRQAHGFGRALPAAEPGELVFRRP